MTKDQKIIPSHTRTIFIFDHSRQIQKFILKIPDMMIQKDGFKFYYYPVEDGYACVSPFYNTYKNNEICLGEEYHYDVNSALKTIYNTVYYESGFCQSWEKYACDQQSYFKFLKDWKETKTVNLVKIDPVEVFSARISGN
jgi:hypothetical protein